MINEKNAKRFCNGDITEIENYELVMKDETQTWHCHHRLETHTSDGQRRLVDLTKEELKVFGMYYNRSPEELIFMTKAEHRRLHLCGKRLGEEHKRKIGESMTGKKHSEETKRKISEAHKGSKAHNSKKVLCVETNTIFNSAKEAADLIGIDRSNIGKCCKGNQETCGGYHWRYAEQADFANASTK